MGHPLPENALFMNEDVREILHNRIVIVLGDSIQRSVYKDLVCLYSEGDSRYLTDAELRRKGEDTFLKDVLLAGGKAEGKTNGIDYREVREFRGNGSTRIRYYFITRCYNEYVESVLNELRALGPDVIIINSTFWDIHLYGEQGKKQFQPNLSQLCRAVSWIPSKPLFIWSSALPLAKYCKGGFLRQGFKTLPLQDIVKANQIAREVIESYPEFYYLDLFYNLPKYSIFEQATDGIHWGFKAHRKMSNSILTVVCHHWKICFPVVGEP
ncbi:predicted protein, partial [Nematostella vectensis]